MKLKNIIDSLTAKFAALALALVCAGNVWATTVATEAELRAAIANGGTVTLGGNIALTQGEIAVSNTVTLDLATFTISSPTNVFRVAANGNFTVNADATNPGGISTTATNACVYTAYGLNPGPKTIVLNGGVFSGNCVFNFSQDAANNIQARFGIPVSGYGSGEKADPTSVTINGGVYTNGWYEGNVGAYRCYYFTVNGGTFERGLDCADTPTCSIGVTTTCKAFFNGGRYRDRYPTFRRKQYADDPGKVFIGTATHTNVYYYADGYYVNAYDYSACQCTGRWRGAMVEDANILLYFVTQCWQNWMTTPTRKVWYFLTEADAQSVNAGGITPVNGAENTAAPQMPAADESVRSATATVFAASPLKSAKRLLGATSQEVPLAKGNSESDNTSPDSVSTDWRDKITVSSIADWPNSFASVKNDDAYITQKLQILDANLDAGNIDDDEYDVLEAQVRAESFKNREDMDACYVFNTVSGTTFKTAEWSIVLKLSKVAAAKSMEFYLAYGNQSVNVDKRVLGALNSSNEYTLPINKNDNLGDSSSNGGGLLSNFAMNDKQVVANNVFPFFVAIKNTDSANEGIRVEVQFRIDDTVCAAYTHDIGEYIPKGKKPVEGSFSEYNGNNEHWGEYDSSLKDDSGKYMGPVYTDTRAALSLAFNAIENVSETGLESVTIAAEDGATQEKWVQIEWHGLVGIRNGAPMTTFAFGVEPMLAVTAGNETTTRTITNTELNNQTIKFHLPLTDAYTARALVVHTSDDANYPEERWIANVAGSTGARYVEISTTHFSEFTVSPLGADDIVYVTSAAGAFIGGYTTLADAYAATEDGGTIYLLQNVSQNLEVSTAKTFNINAGEFAYSGAVTAASGYVLSSSTSGTTTTYTVFVAVAQIGDVKYASFEKAIADAQGGDTILLLADATLDAAVTVSMSLTITLDGHSITGTITAGTGYELVTSDTAYVVRGAGYAGEVLPAGPGMSGDVINVTAANAQYTLDGAYGDINGKTINFTESIAAVLELCRATKYEGSGTSYKIGYNTDNLPLPWSEENIATIKAHNGMMTYYRTVSNIVFTANQGVTLQGFAFTNGYHETGKYDFAREITVNDSGFDDKYVNLTSLNNITFEDLTFNGNVTYSVDVYHRGLESTSVSGITFNGCSFANTSAAAIHMLNDENTAYIDNTVVSNCTFTSVHQGVYVNKPNGATIVDNYFYGTGHNAIAMQSANNSASRAGGDITIIGNYATGVGDRVVRFNYVGADANITINNNVFLKTAAATASESDVIKGTDIASGATVDLEYTYWNGATTSDAIKGAFTRFLPTNTGINSGTWKVDVSDYVAPGYAATDNGDGTWTVAQAATPVAQIGTTKYETLAAAILAAQDGDTIEILDGTWGADAVGTMTTSEKLSVRGKSLTIQPAEGATPKFTSTILSLGYDDSSTTTRNAAITVRGLAFENTMLLIGNYAQVTVEDCSFVGSNGNSSSKGALAIIESCASNYNRDEFILDQVTVRNCTFDGTNSEHPALRLRNSGNVLITGNTIANSNHNGILLESNTTVNKQVTKTVVIQDNTITEWNAGNVSGGGRGIRADLGEMAAGSTVTISGNTFRKGSLGLDEPDFVKITGAGSAAVDISGNDWNNMLLSEVKGKRAIYTCDDVTATLDSVITTKVPVARIGTTQYETLAGAIEAAQDGDTVQLLADISVGAQTGNTSAFKVAGKSITIDGDGKTITATGDGKGFVFWFCEDANKKLANCSLKNLTINSTGYHIDILVGGNGNYLNTLSVDKVSVTTQGEALYASDISEITATESSFAQNGKYTSGLQEPYYAAVTVGYAGVITLTDCTVSAVDGSYAVAPFPSGGTINLNTTTVTGDLFAWVGNGQTATPADTVINVNSGKIAGNYGYRVTYNGNGHEAVINVNGGVFKNSPANVEGVVIKNGYEVVANTDAETKDAYPWTVAHKAGYIVEDKDGEGYAVIPSVDSDWIEKNVKPAGATTAEIEAALNAPDTATGLKKWEAYVLNQTAPIKADKIDGNILSTNLETPKDSDDTGLAVTYSLVSVDGESETDRTPSANKSFALETATDGSLETGLYKVRVHFKPTGDTSASEITVDSENTVGVLKTQPTGQFVVVPVPFKELGGNDAPVKVSSYIRSGLADGDVLHVYNGNSYDSWTYNGTSWDKTTNMTVTDENTASTSESAEPSVAALSRGTAAILRRAAGNTAPLVFVGDYTGAAEEQTIAAGWNLVASPSLEPFDPKTKFTSGKIQIPGDGLPKNYTFKDGKWGYSGVVEVDAPNGNGKIKMPGRIEVDTLPAGTGFWYFSDSQQQVEW